MNFVDRILKNKLKSSLATLPLLASLLGLPSCAVDLTEGDLDDGSVLDEGSIGTVDQALYSAGWEDLGGSVDDLAMTTSGATRFDVWGIASGSVWHKVVENGVGSGWENGAGKPANKTLVKIGAAYRGNGTTDIVAVDSLNRIWVNTWKDSTYSWSGWSTVGAVAGATTDKPGVSTVPSADRLDVWVRGTENSLWHTYRFGSGAWSAWINEGAPAGGLTSAPAVVTRSPSPLVIDILTTGTNGKVWRQTWSNNAWQGWSSPWSASYANGLSLTSNGPNHLTAMGVNTATGLIDRKDWTSATATWSVATLTGAPSGGATKGPVAAYVNKQLEFLATGSSKNVWRRSPYAAVAASQAIIGYWGRCLAVDSTNRAVLKLCDGSPGQAWVRNGDTIKNVASGQCLNVKNAATAAGSPVITSACSATPQPNERWTTPASGTVRQIRGVGSSRCLNVPNSPIDPADNTPLVISNCAGVPSDRWYLGDGVSERIKVRVFALENDRGTSPRNETKMTIAQFRNTLDDSNKLFQRLGIRFEIADADWTVINSTLLNSTYDSASTDPAVQKNIKDQIDLEHALARQAPGYLVVLLRRGVNGGFSGYSGDSWDYAVMQNDTVIPPSLFVHEMGHYFNLYHTMSTDLYCDNTTNPPKETCLTSNEEAWRILVKSGSMDPNVAYNADGLQDTPADPGPWVFIDQGSECAGSDTVTISDPKDTVPPIASVTVAPDRRNLESYFKGCWSTAKDMTISAEQIAVARSALFSSARDHLLKVIK